MDIMTDQLIGDYMRRLELAAAHMRKDRRAELVEEIRGHIDTAMRQEQAAGEAAVRNVLDRLGPPEDIVEAAQPPPTPPVDQRAGRLEIVALIALIVPFIGWLVGAVLAFASRVWSRREKVVGGLLLLAPIVLLGLAVTLAGPSGSEDSVPLDDTRPVGEKVDAPAAPGPFELMLFVAGLPSALYLGWQLRRDPDVGRTESFRA